MARPNYGFQKRQKQLAKQKKKEAKRQQRLENTSETGEAPDELDVDQIQRMAKVMEEVKQRMADLPASGSLYAQGDDLILNFNARPPEESLELAEGFLERADREAEDE